LSYRTLPDTFWDSQWSELPPGAPSARTLLVYLAVGPLQRAVPGVLRTGEGEIADRLGWPLKVVQKLLADLATRGLLQFDRDARLMWLPWRYDHEAPKSPTVVGGKGWRPVFERWPSGELARRVRRELRERLAAQGPAFVEAFDTLPGDPLPPSSPSTLPGDPLPPSSPGTEGGDQRSSEAVSSEAVIQARDFDAIEAADEPDATTELQSESNIANNPEKVMVPDWPADVLEQLRVALGGPNVPQGEWQKFIAESSTFPMERRVAAARKYMFENHAPGTRGPRFVLAMIKAGAGLARFAPPPVDERPVWQQKGFQSHEQFEQAQREAAAEVAREEQEQLQRLEEHRQKQGASNAG
jgi:hypothetical protein